MFILNYHTRKKSSNNFNNEENKLLQTISQAGREFAVTFKESLILLTFTVPLYLLGCHAYGLSVANMGFIYI